jgi:dolichyl-phosphate beta-glucosyltransferase
VDLSIVIPAFEESKKIAADIKTAATFLDKNQLAGEIIVVDDGSKDNTARAAEETAAALPPSVSLKVHHYDRHMGKGYAVRTGIKKTTGDYVMFADSGSCVPFENLLPPLNLLKKGQCDIAHGSRKMHESNIKKPQSLRRRICSRLFRWFVIYYMKIPPQLTDTQCGFKIYRGDVARRLYDQCQTDGFMFDMEIIIRAQKQGCRIKEFPIDWTCDPDSRLSLTKSPWRVLPELINIKKITT